MFFFTYLRRELRHRMRQAVVTALGLALGIGLVITVTALSSGVRDAQGKVLGALFGVGTDITVTTPTQPASANSQGGIGGFTPKPGVQHQDILVSPTQGTLNVSAVAAIARLHDVSAAAVSASPSSARLRMASCKLTSAVRYWAWVNPRAPAAPRKW